MYGNRLKKKSATNRLDHLQAILKTRRHFETIQGKQVEIEKKRQRGFLEQTTDRAEKLQLTTRAKEEGNGCYKKATPAETSCNAKRKARLAEERKQKNVLNEKARIERHKPLYH